MGKYSLLITLGVATALSVLSLQGNQTAQDTSESQAVREAEVLARQVARSGYNAVLSKARLEQQADKSVSEIVSDVGTIRGQYADGTYEAWLEKVSPTSYKAVSVGRFPIMDRVVKHRLGDGYGGSVMVDVPEVDAPSQLNVSFEQSQAGYCSAIYLQRFVPATASNGRNNNGHGNNVDGVDASNPGNAPFEDSNPNVDDEANRGQGAQPSQNNGSGNGGGESNYIAKDPEMIFAAGHNRNDAVSTYDRTIQSGTRLNFILAVDKDCSEEGNTSADFPEDYDHTRRSFQQDVAQLNTMEETPYGMIEETSVGSSQGWRVGFEDLTRFSDAQLWDIKDNGYPGSPDDSDWNSDTETYGGDGWDKNADGTRELRDFGEIPDFSDQVIQVALTSPV